MADVAVAKEDQPDVVVGLIASPGAAAELAESLVDGLTRQMGERLPGVKWTVRVVVDRLVDAPAPLHELVSGTRRRLLDGGWQLAVFLTDLPLQTSRHPVVAHASTAHGVAVLSLPALGAVGVGRRVSEAIVRLVAVLVGDSDAPVDIRLESDGRRRGALLRRLRELGTVAGTERGGGLVTGVVTGNLRLLSGMLRTNRPWRLAIGLSRALVAALAAAVFALITNDVWQLADSLGWFRQALVGAGSVAAVVLTLLLGANLWERAPPQPDPEIARATREQVVMLNVVTITTLVIGVVALYCALYVISLLGVLLLVPPGLHAQSLDHPAGFTDQAELAWLVGALATLGGALGAGLESDETVREAAYAYQPDRPLTG